MPAQIYRFALPISRANLPRVLRDPASEEVEAVDLTVDLSEVNALVHELTTSKEPRSVWDRLLAPILHQSLKGLPRRLAADMRLWQWLCIARFPEFVWHRWYGEVPVDMEIAMRASIAERFLGSSTLRGVSRNALARLWWCADTLYDDDRQYELVMAALENQDFFQAIFERNLGLYPPAVRACIKVLRNAGEEERRQAVRRLNHLLTTIALEVLSQDQIEDLLREARS